VGTLQFFLILLASGDINSHSRGVKVEDAEEVS